MCEICIELFGIPLVQKRQTTKFSYETTNR